MRLLPMRKNHQSRLLDLADYRQNYLLSLLAPVLLSRTSSTAPHQRLARVRRTIRPNKRDAPAVAHQGIQRKLDPNVLHPSYRISIKGCIGIPTV